MAGHLLAIDQGTTGSTALVVDTEGHSVGRANVEFPQHYPRPGWVEHNPEELWQSVLQAVTQALSAANLSGDSIAAIGITNQRETTVLWERSSGRAVHPAIVWQDRRTADRCKQMKDDGLQETVRSKTGLVIDPYFSGTKLSWLLDNAPAFKTRAENGDLAFGTIDSFLVYRLTQGKSHVTDVSNASRTMLMNLQTLAWDDDMMKLLGVPAQLLPTIVQSAQHVGVTRGLSVLPDGIPITGMAGDQHAALFGQACFDVGDVKCTFGTGAFVLINTGSKPVFSRYGLLTTLGWSIGNKPVYAVEGSAFIAGAAVQWLRDGFHLIGKAPEIEALARQVDSSDGVMFVPALSGLGAPYWDPAARGLIWGLTRGSTAAHLARATLEGIAHEVADLVQAMSDDLGYPVGRIRVDGGASANNLLMQMQADLAGITVERPRELETTARGAAMLAAVGLGLFDSPQAASGMLEVERTFEVQMPDPVRKQHRANWNDAIRRSRGV